MNSRRFAVSAAVLLGGFALGSMLAAPAYAATTVGVVLNGSELRMTGSDFADDIEIRAEGNAVVVISRNAQIFNGSDSGCSRINDSSVRCPGVSTLNVQLGLGNDRFLNNTNRPSVVGGGVGADDITGGAGDDTLSGGNGNDTLDGAGGRDTVTGGNNIDKCIGEVESPTCES
ncbi:calcium-binding protein [Nocardia lasii]|uniref:Calcium-binding protein n=1 Tax=Nocardia lasii TaxID=1616107 RepID=A0ABW1JNC6_9NOCA